MRANIVSSINIMDFNEYEIQKTMETMPVESGFRVIITDISWKVNR